MHTKTGQDFVVWLTFPSVAPIQGAGEGRRPPQASQNNINFIGFIDSMFNM